MKSVAFLLVIFLSCLVPARSQSTWYVDASAACPGAGTQLSPYCDLQYAIDRPTTLSGDTILVLPGTYFGRILILGKSLTIRSTGGASITEIKNQVPVGFSTACTIVVRGQGGTTVEFEGWTIECGLGLSSDPGDPTGNGGGINCLGSSLVVRDCAFNRAPLPLNKNCKAGGGIYLEDSAFAMVGITITGLRGYTGAGVACVASTGTMDQCLFQGNGATIGGLGRGGGVYCDTLGVVIRDCEFTQNFEEHFGGAVYGPATIEDCQFFDNEIGFGKGDAVYKAESVTNCLVSGNDVLGAGGGLAWTRAMGCVLQGNSAAL